MAAPSPNSSFLLPQTSYPYPNTSGGEVQGACNPFGHMLAAQSLPERASSSSLGYLNIGTTSGGTTLADNIQAMPTTSANFVFTNREPQVGGKTYILETAGFVTTVVDATQTNSHLLLANLQTYANIVTNGPYSLQANTSFTITTMNATPYKGKAFGTASTTAAGGLKTITNNGWFNLGASAPSGQAAAGAIWIGQEAQINGRIVLPPGAGIGLAVISLAIVTASTFYTISWHEVQLPIAS